MMSAAECREFARWYRARADEMASPGRAVMLRNVAYSLSGLATQLDMITEVEQQMCRFDHAAGLQIAQPPADTKPAARM